MAFDVGPHNFHAARVDQELCSSLHTGLNHVLCAWGGRVCIQTEVFSLCIFSLPIPNLDEGTWLPSPGPWRTTAGRQGLACYFRGRSAHRTDCHRRITEVKVKGGAQSRSGHVPGSVKYIIRTGQGSTSPCTLTSWMVSGLALPNTSTSPAAWMTT